jgi:hypothetical protein
VATKTAPGTLFLSPAPTATMIHAGVTANCNSCHETNYQWMSMGPYPITTTSPFKGFHTRPQVSAGVNFVADAKHPTTGDCSSCHSTSDFSGITMPSNHIPVAATASCTSCHTNTDFAVMPTLTAIHAYAPTPSSNCAQCHSTANAATYAIPAIGFTIMAPPAKHVPFGTTACEVCHVGAGSSLQLPVVNGALFTKSLFSHSGITTGCVTCHGQGITSASFTGITSIVVMPPSTTQGATSHIPSTASCETCHVGAGSIPSTLMTVTGTKTVPGSLFKTPTPTGPMIHSGITSGCNACHEKNFQWMGVALYPITPTTVTSGALYKGFQTRPFATASTYSVADAAHPTTGDCSACHSGTTSFSAAGKPNGHMPTTIAACTTCHVKAGDYSYAAGSLATNAILHTGIASGCISCHTAGTGAGPFAGCATQASCTAPPPITYQPKMMPLAAGASPTASNALTHVPVAGIACEACHSKTNFTAFSGTTMAAAAHTAVASKTCMSCHEYKYTWFGVKMKTRDGANHHAGQDCDGSGCHSYAKGFRAMVRPVMRGASVNPELGRLLPNLQVTQPGLSTASTSFDHAGVQPGQCKTCHDGQHASGMPARHLMVTSSCDTCHRTTAWVPAQFSHTGISPNTCLVCHNGMGASARPSGHFMSPRSCDSCHKTTAWEPVNYSHLSPAFRPMPDKLTCISCHVSNSEIIPRQMRARIPGKPIPIGP